MKKNILSIGKILLLTLLVLVFSIVILLPVPVVTAMNPTTTVYLDTPTINATEADVNTTITVNLMIRDAVDMDSWQAGMIFNATLLNCTGFFEGEFLKNVGSTYPMPGIINNTVGVITAYGYSLTVSGYANGNGRLAYLTFKVKAAGVSDLHLHDVRAYRDFVEVLPINMIDVYTVIVDTLPHTVVIFSNSTGSTGWYGSGFYNHAFNLTLEEISFNVTAPKPGFSNVTIPKALLNVSALDEWKIMIDSILVSRIITENGTHYFIYFTYALGIHEIQITTRPLVSSTISIVLSSSTITLGSNVTISGNITAEDHTGRPDVNVTIQSRPVGTPDWNMVDTVKTDSNSNYTYTWTPETAETYDVKANWKGDPITGGAESEVLSLTVLKMPSTISISLNSTSVTLGYNVTISGNITADDPINSLRPDVDVTIHYRPSDGEWNTLPTVKTDQHSNYNCTFKVEKIGIYINKAGTYEVKASWNGDLETFGAESEVLSLTVLKTSSTISIALSSTNITLGSNVSISGTIDPWRAVATVTIQYRFNGGEWTWLANVTAVNSNYNHTWTPAKAGTYEVKASWDGDESTESDESDVLSLTVEKKAQEGIPLEIVIVLVVAIVAIAAAIAVYFIRFRKPKPGTVA